MTSPIMRMRSRAQAAAADNTLATTIIMNMKRWARNSPMMTESGSTISCLALDSLLQFIAQTLGIVK